MLTYYMNKKGKYSKHKYSLIKNGFSQKIDTHTTKMKGKNERDMVETVVFGSNADMKNRNAIQIQIS